MIDAVSSQASILRTNTVMVLEKNVTLAFEGCNDHSGCCPMNCPHVYNYEQAMALWPVPVTRPASWSRAPVRS